MVAAPRLLAALSLLAALLGLVLPAQPAAASTRTAAVSSTVASAPATGTVRAGARTDVVRAGAGARAAIAPTGGSTASGSGGPDLAVLRAVPVVVPPVLLVRPPPPLADALPSSLPAGPTGRSPPAAAAV